ncbi:lysophospholipid acyltransferase family protein [Sphingobacterium lumbrici]|uniref:lysophospholipid acyltransferase family protein n=1 Tax=Sphingobacterium lumbrici TaxID=2559600 RepID=UPI00112B8925|nr:lysophospholipid acyltransferase family protein [Sphingobacterium lumbrici]
MNRIYNFLGFFIGSLCHYRSQVTVQNLARAFPNASYGEVMQYRRSFYRNMGRILVESIFPFLPKLIAEPETIKHLQQIHHNKRNIILMIGHYGNWEALNKLPLTIDIPIQALYKPLKSKLWNSIAIKLRENYGARLIPSQHGIRTLIKEKDKPSITIFIADQFPGYQNGLPMKFMNQDTFIFTGAEKVAKKLNAFVAYVEMQPMTQHHWKIKLETICDYASETEDGFITKVYTQNLEKSIQREPSWWLWTHRRWK